MPKFVIRSATLDDVTTITEFNLRLAEETERVSLDRELVTQGVTALIGERSRGNYWVARSGGTIVGQLMHTREWSDWRNGDIWWIQSVYVGKDHRRRGVFTQLHSHLKALATSDPGVVGLRLYVEFDNLAARTTYERLGLNTARYQVMEDLFSSS